MVITQNDCNLKNNLKNTIINDFINIYFILASKNQI